jgi:hypothetical protein
MQAGEPRSGASTPRLGDYTVESVIGAARFKSVTVQCDDASRLCARMGGTLELRSAPGVGTTVRIRLPAQPPM